jgi:hypothetical protein
MPLKVIDYIRLLKITFAPESDENIKERTMEMEGFRKYYQGRIGKSKLEIKMDLINRNKKDIFENLDTVFDDSDLGTICEEISKRKKCASNKT